MNNNVYLCHTRDPENLIVAITKDGSEHIFNGVPDWIYEGIESPEDVMKIGLRLLNRGDLPRRPRPLVYR